MVATRPRIVLAMYRGLERALLADAHWARLESCGELLSRRALTDFTTDEHRALLARAEVVLAGWGCPPLDDAALDAAPDLRLLAYLGGSLREGPGETVVRRGILATTAAAANARPVAEFTLAMILLANKDAFSRRERFRRGDTGLLGFSTLEDVGNVGARIGIVGASRIGRLLIELLRPFALEVVITDPFLSAEEAHELGVTKVELDELVRTAHVVTLHAPSLPGTRHLIGAAELAAMRNGATLINTARGPLVDHEALAAEVEAGRLRAVLDVTEPEPLPADATLWQLPDAFVTPHIAGSQGRELHRLADLAVAEVERFARGEPPVHLVRPEDLDRIA